jgi:hypothetical protein
MTRTAPLKRKRPVLAIDPGNERSAYVVFDGSIVEFGILSNHELLSKLGVLYDAHRPTCAIEMIASYGMAVGASVFETCVWIGRFMQEWFDWNPPESLTRITRNQVKSHVCHSARANDSNIRQALIDRFGEPGIKKNPGPTYGISADVWAALAVAVTAWDQAEQIKAFGGGE